MKKITFLVILYALVNHCNAVPPTPVDRLWDELDNTKVAMNNIATQLERFNSLYLVQLEQKVLSVATALANIDSNIKNLQERAHVWDTFQLHVAAWNDQISTLDKKVEIISRGQEKILASDAKLSAISNIEYKVERLLGKQDDNLILLQAMAKLIENQPHDPLLGEFTVRGVLSTLKIIERKVDKLQMQFSSSQSMLAKQLVDNKRKSEKDGEEQKGRLLIKCNTPPKVEEILNDVAAKVDVMFDKFSGTEENTDYPNTEEERDSSEITSQEFKPDSDLKLIKGLLKRLNQPCKKTIKTLETVETSVKTIDNTTISILEQTQNIYTNLLSYCQNNDKKILTVTTDTQSIVNKLEDFMNNINNNLAQEQKFVTNQFYEQKEYIENILLAVNAPTVTEERSTNVQEEKSISDPIVVDSNTPDPENVGILSSKSSCDELDSTDVNGVYTFGVSKNNFIERNYNSRYCYQNEDGFWTVIQSRGINPSNINFTRSWKDYKLGFGSLDEDFWFGNDFIHKLTHETDMTLRIELEAFNGATAWAEYSFFKVLSEAENYKMLIGVYNGNASDSFSAHNKSKFSTYDRTNDDAPACCPCAPSYGGGWWFYSCFEANLNGVYYPIPYTNEHFTGLIWEHWLGNYSLKKTRMMLRPVGSNENEAGSGVEPNVQINPLDEDIPEDP